ncbi:MAG: hypothetical protein JKY46_09250 [Robiginitomaculum sp.]|nr:hypothetical protein [Robiginitomaculum sp.]
MTKTVDGLDFSEVKFFGDVDFRDRMFPKGTDFTKANFYGLAKFHGCEFHYDTSFDYAVFNLPKKYKTNETKDTYNKRIGKFQRTFQVLRLHMEKNGAIAGTFKFARLEMQAKQRRSNDVSFWERFQSRLFGIFADYGQSAGRPFLWLIIFFALATGAYWLIAKDAANLGAATAIAFQYSLPPVSTIASQFFTGEIDPVFANALLDKPFWTRLVMTLHGILSLVMLFFLLLALKRRFQIR